MLSDNIKTLRKNKGFTQEDLAIRVHVVRQTVSKWEKGLSVPDADALQRLAEELEVPVEELLGTELPTEDGKENEVARQLARINEQLAVRNKRSKFLYTLLKVFLGILLGGLALFLVLVLGRTAVSGIDSALSKNHSYTVDYGTSDLYSKKDMDAAIRAIMKDFNDNDDGKKDMLSIEYAGDERAQTELEYCRSLDPKAEFDECIVFVSSFRTRAEESYQAFDAVRTFTGWTWILARPSGGRWVVVTNGYA